MREKSSGKVDLMEFQSVIEQILAANQKAEDARNAAEEERKSAILKIDERKAELKNEYYERAERRIKIIDEQEKAFADEKINAANENFAKKTAELDRLAEKNKDEWAKQLFKTVIEGL